MHTKKNIASGFTLIELMVTISIFTMLVIAFYSGSTHTFQNRTQLREEITAIQTLYENARNMAITSSSVNASDGTSVVSQYGYGVYANFITTSPTFILFADNNPEDTDGDGTNDSYGNGIFDANDTKISEYTAFTKSIATTMQTKAILFHNSGATADNKTLSKDESNIEFTVLFAPLDAHPTLLLNNDLDPENKKYKAFTLHFYEPYLLEEELNFNTIARFFERIRICPAKNATPQDCSTLSTL